MIWLPYSHSPTERGDFAWIRFPLWNPAVTQLPVLFGWILASLVTTFGTFTEFFGTLI